jgi:hypothetical protein
LDELLTNAMLLVLPSYLEGLSLALLDAMGRVFAFSPAIFRKIENWWRYRLYIST